ncbi:hypothetical protein [Olivibacter domesticus]|uniref:Uncharacterized protein n=1 Tax=Olivibacter domesticus TaxID=407022 RepID=A0A1H7WPJ0_OLID1|nr:hypothetical protein [Olivibacter domesticus]SEM23085.1 hypothetical protein SAMN05661044_04588 [Olivibacter domesticus]
MANAKKNNEAIIVPSLKAKKTPNIKYKSVIENISDAKPGYIFWAARNFNKNNKHSHYMTFLSSADENQTYLFGVMFTASVVARYNNILLKKEHFKQAHSDGFSYDFPVKPTLFVPKKFIKFEYWNPFYLVGELSIEGLKFIKAKIGDMAPEIYEENMNIEYEENIVTTGYKISRII